MTIGARVVQDWQKSFVPHHDCDCWNQKRASDLAARIDAAFALADYEAGAPEEPDAEE